MVNGYESTVGFETASAGAVPQVLEIGGVALGSFIEERSVAEATQGQGGTAMKDTHGTGWYDVG